MVYTSAMSHLDIRSFTSSRRPTLPYTKMAQAVLPSWELSLVFAAPKEAQKLNKQLRRKSYVPNVLSYPVGKKSGEIVICLSEAKRQAPDFDLSYRGFVGLLFIHALLHLKGRRHGPTMEREERRLLSRFVPT